MALLRSVLMQNAFLGVTAINSAPRTLAMSQDGVEFVDDDVALLQTSATHNKTSSAQSDAQQAVPREEAEALGGVLGAPQLDMDLINSISEPLFHHDEPEFGSYLTEDQLHCLEGPFTLSELQHSMTRATPLSVLMYSQPYAGGVTCVSRGFTELLQEHDECFHSVTRWIKPGSPPERTLAGRPSGGLWAAALDRYDEEHHFAVGNSRRFVACWLCEEGSAMRNGEIWDLDCSLHPEAYIASSRGADIPNGFVSVVPAGDEVCYEGQTDYIEGVVANVRRTPMGRLFPQSMEFSTQNCQERGFDRVRDMLDECWPDARKFIRSAFEDIYMVNWIGRYSESINNYDSTELSDGRWTTMDWVSCSCDVGGAVRDRGMWQSMHGGDSIPYTDSYCSAMNFPDFQTL